MSEFKELQKIIDFDSSRMFTAEELLKVQIVKTAEAMFDKYSALDSFHLVRKYDVFVPEIIRVCPKEVLQIKEKNYVDYCETYFKNKKLAKCIEIKNGKKVSFNDIQEELRDNFIFLYMKNELSKKITQNEKLVLFEKKDHFGNININYKKYAEDFLGQNLLIKYHYIALGNKIKSKDKAKKQNKI